MKKLFIALTATLLFIACDDDKKNKSSENDVTNKTETKEVKKKEEIYRIAIKGVFPEDGLISMNYLENASLQFNGDQYAFEKIKGSDDVQTVTFELPKGILLEKFRIHPNFPSKENGNMQLEEITISINGDEIVMTPENMLTYLNPNIFVSMTKGSPKVTYKTMEKDGKTLFSPFIISNQKLTNALIDL